MLKEIFERYQLTRKHIKKNTQEEIDCILHKEQRLLKELDTLPNYSKLQKATNLAIEMSGFNPKVCVTTEYPEGIHVLEVNSLGEDNSGRDKFITWEELE